MSEQHFFTKAALIILESRVNLPMLLTKDGEARLEKWVWFAQTGLDKLYTNQ